MSPSKLARWLTARGACAKPDSQRRASGSGRCADEQARARQHRSSARPWLAGVTSCKISGRSRRFNCIARLPRPVRHERGEGRGEGCSTLAFGVAGRNACSSTTLLGSEPRIGSRGPCSGRHELSSRFMPVSVIYIGVFWAQGGGACGENDMPQNSQSTETKSKLWATNPRKLTRRSPVRRNPKPPAPIRRRAPRSLPKPRSASASKPRSSVVSPGARVFGRDGHRPGSPASRFPQPPVATTGLCRPCSVFCQLEGVSLSGHFGARLLRFGHP